MKQLRIIVTGARGLLGAETCAYLAQQGHDVLRLDLTLGHDLSDEAFVAHWFGENPADALVNLFALNDHVGSEDRHQSFLDVPLDSFRMYMDINVTALFSTCREFIRANDAGSIVNASSIYGVVTARPMLYGGGEKHPGYGPSKSAVISLTKHLAVHAAPKFRVNCLVIGGVANEQPLSFLERYSQTVPLGRMANKADLPPLIDFLVSPASGYMTGSVVTVDGGWTA